jgi:hypothetical protein
MFLTRSPGTCSALSGAMTYSPHRVHRWIGTFLPMLSLLRLSQCKRWRLKAPVRSKFEMTLWIYIRRANIQTAAKRKLKAAGHFSCRRTSSAASDTLKATISSSSNRWRSISVAFMTHLMHHRPLPQGAELISHRHRLV